MTVRPTLFINTTPPAETSGDTTTHINSGSTKVRFSWQCSLPGLHLAHFKRQPINTWQFGGDADGGRRQTTSLSSNWYSYLNFYFCLWMFVLVCSCCSRSFSASFMSDWFVYKLSVIRDFGHLQVVTPVPSRKIGQKKEKTFGVKCSTVSYEEWVISTDTYF